MKTAEAKHTSPAHPSLGTRPFFQKEGGESTFFSDSQTDIQTKPFFWNRATQPFIQAKITIGQPGDRYEQEADAMADQVVQRLSHPETIQTKPATPLANTVTQLVQLKCAACEEEEQIQKKEEDEDRLEHGIQLKPVFDSYTELPENALQTKPLHIPVIQPKCSECQNEENEEATEMQNMGPEIEDPLYKKSIDSIDETDNAVSPDFADRLQTRQKTGRPLSPQIESEMNEVFGANFKTVRIHDDEEAVQMSSEIGAQAFTRGTDIYFNRGKYNPSSQTGKHLLAHELTHVMQQRKTDITRREVNTEENRAQNPGVDIVFADTPHIQRQGGGVVIPIPDITLFHQRQYSKLWSTSSGNITLGQTSINIPRIGPVDLSLYVRGDAIAQLLASLGPGMLRHIRITLDPLGSRYSGQAQVFIPANVLSQITLNGFIGGNASYGGAQIGFIEGGLHGIGTGSLPTALIGNVSVTYSSGNISFGLGMELNTCLVFSFDLAASANLNLLGHPIWTRRWNLFNKSWQNCWRIGANMALVYGPNGLEIVGPDFEAESPDMSDILPFILGIDQGSDELNLPPVDPQTGLPTGTEANILASCQPVTPGGNPNVTEPGPNNTCTPSTNSAVLNWDVISVDTDNWGVCVKGLTLKGQINIKPWPSRPNQMVVPNTPNPVDGGNINNTAGSNNHWQYAIDDMADYDTAGSGGAGAHWHSTVASRAHEWAHWNQDYKNDAVTSAGGGNWSNINNQVNSLREPKSSSASAADARRALKPRVDALFSNWKSNTISRWNVIVNSTDSPGSGGRGYAAGMQVLNGLIAGVRAYKDSKGW